MEDLRIIAENLAQKNEIITMLIDIGYKRDLFLSCDSDDLMGIHVYSSGEIQDVLDEDYNDKRHKEITTQQLRDLVVLKRNDVKDATHECGTGHNRKGYLTSKKQEYYWAYADKCWKPTLSVCNFETLALKPIEKEMKMKEYLEKQADGSYELVLAYRKEWNNWIEVPEVAEIAIFYPEDNDLIFYTENFEFMYVNGRDAGFSSSNWGSREFGRLEHLLAGGNRIVWKRSEAELTLNDQYAEIEQVRQSAWDKQTGGDHYKKLAIQPMEYALKNKLDYAQANVVKYVTRHADKNGKEDLLKAIHNIELMIEHYYS